MCVRAYMRMCAHVHTYVQNTCMCTCILYICVHACVCVHACACMCIVFDYVRMCVCVCGVCSGVTKA